MPDPNDGDRDLSDAELWRTMPPLDDETIERLQRLLFPRAGGLPLVERLRRASSP